MSKMQRDKGKVGEREVVELIWSHGFEARRGQQHRGGGDSPDVIHNIPNVHVEVKRRETFSLYPALEQAREEAVDAVPVVFHRRSRKPWVVVLYADDFLAMMEVVAAYQEEYGT